MGFSCREFLALKREQCLFRTKIYEKFLGRQVPHRKIFSTVGRIFHCTSVVMLTCDTELLARLDSAHAFVP